MHLVRKLVLTCLVTNICFSAKYIPGLNNGIANILSWFQVACFWQLAPGAHLHLEMFLQRPLEAWQQLTMQGVLDSAAPSMAQAYNRAILAFTAFTSLFGVPELWPVPKDLLYYLAHLRERPFT